MMVAPAVARSGTLASSRVTLAYHTDPALGLVLDSVGDAQQPAAFALDATDLWELELWDVNDPRHPAAPPAPVVLRPSEASFTFSVAQSGSQLVASWSDVGSPLLAPGETLSVTVTIAVVPGEPLLAFDASVATSTPTRALYAIRFPRLHVPSHGAPATQTLTAPIGEGWLLPDPIGGGVLPAAGGPGVPFIHPSWNATVQFFAYYDAAEADPALLFLGTRDATFHRKEFDLRRNPTAGTGRLELTLRYVPENNLSPDGDYVSPFSFVLGVLRGDWYDAARSYRAWALGQPWAEKGPMRENADFSPLVSEPDLFAVSGTTAGPSDYQYWLRDLEDEASTFGVSGTPTHIYGWHHNPFDVDWGDWFPIAPEFLAAAPSVAAAGFPFAPYFYAQAYSTVVPSFANPYVPGFEGAPLTGQAVRDEQGQVVLVKDKAGNDAAVLCHAAPFMPAYLAYMAEQLHDQAGAQGIYLDVYSVDAPNLCYEPSHGHPLGGGDYYTQQARDAVASLRQQMKAVEPGFFVYSEAVNEAFVDLFELVYAHHTGDTVEPVIRIAPIYETVYHDFQIVNTVAELNAPPAKIPPSAADLLRRTYAAKLFFGHAAWAGTLLSPATFAENVASSPEYGSFIQAVGRFVAVLRQDDVRRAVTFGARLREPPTDAELVAPRPGEVFLPFGASQPVVYASAWQDAPRGGLGLLLLNWTAAGESLPGGVVGGDRTVALTVDPARYGLVPGTYAIDEFDEAGPTPLGTVDLSAAAVLSEAVPERSARFLALRPAFCAAPAPGVCSPGGFGKRECALELRVDPTPPLKKGIPGRRLDCTDGDPACDLDGTADGQCLFRIRICAASSDPRIACSPDPVSEVSVLRPSAQQALIHPEDAANRQALLSAVATLPLEAGGTDLCAPRAADVAVPLRVTPTGALKKGRKTIRLGAALEAGGKDRDSIRLRCLVP